MLSALRIHPFGRLLATYTLDEAADWLVGIALAVFVYERTQSALAVAGLLIAIRFGPSLVIAPLSGRLGTRRLGAALGTLYLGAAGVSLLLAAAAAAGAPLMLLYLLVFTASTLAATGRVLTRTASSNLLDEHDKLREGIAALNVSAAAISVLGPAVGGAITVLVGSQAAVLVAAAIFTGLAASTFTLRGSAADADANTDQVGDTVPMREALRALAAGPGVAAILVASTLLLVLFCMDEPILLPYVEQSLGGSTSQYATLLTFWGVGLLLGGLAFTLLRRWSMLGTFVLSGSLFAGAYLLLGSAHTVAIAYGAAVIGGMGNGMFWGTITVVTLEAVPASMRAQTSGITEGLALATPGIGYLLGGGLSEILTPAQVYLLAGTLGGCVVALLAIGLWPPTRRLLRAGMALTPSIPAVPSTSQGR